MPGPGLPDALRPLVAAPDRAAIFADFDGSLAPIVPDPTRARVLPVARDALAQLVPRFPRVVVVSGRPASFLRDALPVDGLLLVGEYGLERVVGGEVVVDERVVPYTGAVEAVADAAEAALPGVRVERKGRVAVTLHWREQPDRADEIRAWASEAARRFGLDAPLRGRMTAELRPPVPVDKGTTVADLAAGFDTAAFAGDDVGDVPAFAALAALVTRGDLSAAVSIGVRSPESPPEVLTADVVVDGPAGLAALFDGLARAVDAR